MWLYKYIAKSSLLTYIDNYLMNRSDNRPLNIVNNCVTSKGNSQIICHSTHHKDEAYPIKYNKEKLLIFVLGEQLFFGVFFYLARYKYP